MRKLIGISLVVGLLAVVAALMALSRQRIEAGRPRVAGSAIQPVRLDSLTEAEKRWITTLRVDEKIARDTYQTLGAKWNMPVLSNIALSEQKHMDAVGALIAKYGLTDPVGGLAVGEFPPEFQPLYDSLVEKGRPSAKAACQVGVDIEVLDIADLDKGLAETRNADIEAVFTRLRGASYRHLSAFRSHL